jgi:hypothetical protein
MAEQLVVGTWDCPSCSKERAKASRACPHCGDRNLHPVFEKQVEKPVWIVLGMMGLVLLFGLFLIFTWW